MRTSKPIMCAMMSIFVWTWLVGLLAPSVMAEDALARFEGGIGVIPVSSAAGAPNTDGTFPNVNRNVVRGVNPAGQIWVIRDLNTPSCLTKPGAMSMIFGMRTVTRGARKGGACDHRKNTPGTTLGRGAGVSCCLQGG
jgi:hypothetical protein